MPDLSDHFTSLNKIQMEPFYYKVQDNNPLYCREAFAFPISSKERRLSIIRDIALHSINELAVSLAFAGVTCLFVASPAIPTLLIATIGIVALNILFRCLAGYTALEIEQAKEKNVDDEYLEDLQFSHQLLQFLCPINFSILDMSTRNILVHEAGHAIAAVALYQNARPTIEVFPLTGGVTRFSVGSLTKIGEFFGRKWTSVIVSAAGPAIAIIAASLNLGLSHYYAKENPELHRYFLCMSIASIAQHVLYALSALWEKNPSGHDFIKLWKVGGIHPLFSVVGLIALPLIMKSIFFTIDYYRDN